MSQTVEQKKIKRLESQIKGMKETISLLERRLSTKESELYSAMEWRRSLQRLMREVVQDDVQEKPLW